MIPESTRGESCLSDLTLDRLLLDELDEGPRSQALAHLQGCAACAARRRELDDDRARFQQSPRRLGGGKVVALAGWRARRGWVAGAAGALLAASLALVVTRTPRDDEGAGERRKGGAFVSWYLQRGGEVRQGRAEDVLQQGDRLRFTLFAESPGFGAVVSRADEAHGGFALPSTGRMGALVPGANELPGAIELDAAEGAEELVVFRCARELSLDELRAAARAPTGADAPEGCEAAALSLLKRAASR
ncbi:MAG: hypothetical protein IT383_12295 [Deltaproteobacteria bacterium]|nr:hypothetical protein [Deltaproteobacteria bacterium]